VGTRVVYLGFAPSEKVPGAAAIAPNFNLRKSRIIAHSATGTVLTGCSEARKKVLFNRLCASLFPLSSLLALGHFPRTPSSPVLRRTLFFSLSFLFFATN
jgi:hypothetical protein